MVEPLDRYYTPDKLAAAMIVDLAGTAVGAVADFTAGAGSLLSAASMQWPDADVFAVDVDGVAVENLRQSHKQWRVLEGDFLDPSTADRVHTLLKEYLSDRDGIDLIILNPPFSARGNRRATVAVGDLELKLSPPAAFVIFALQFLRHSGRLRAVVPRNTLTSDKDRLAWRAIRRDYRVSVVRQVPRGTFTGATAQAVVLDIARHREPAQEVQGQSSVDPTLHSPSWRRLEVQITRGNLPVHRLKTVIDGDLQVIHSTSLRGVVTGNLNPLTAVNYAPGVRVVTGDCILLPRVGLPAPDYVKPMKVARPVGLTDCVLAVTGSEADLLEVAKRLVSNWPRFQDAYGGSCARYITVSGLVGFLESLAIDALCTVTRRGT